MIELTGLYDFKEEAMPRKPRFYLPYVPVHIVQRGHSREPVFFEDQDYATYTHWLKESGFAPQPHKAIILTPMAIILWKSGNYRYPIRALPFIKWLLYLPKYPK